MTRVFKLGLTSGAFTLAALALAVAPANAERGGNGKGKGGKDTTAVATFSETVDCSGGSGGVLSEIDVGADYSQCFSYTISVTVPDDWTVFDVAPTTFDVSPEGEDCAFDDGDGTTDICTDGAADGMADGWSLAQTGGVGDCVIAASQPDSVDGPNPPPQEPEFFTVITDGNGTAQCDVTVWLKTVLHNKSDCSAGNPEVCEEGVDDLVYRPASCHVVSDADGNIFLDGEGDPVVDSFNLHAAKVFDATGVLFDLDGGDFVYGQELVATDTDADGTPDCIDPEPLNPSVE